MRLDDAHLHRWFKFGVMLKGIDGALELAGGLALHLTSPVALRGLVGWMTRGELQEDPTDYVANHLVRFTHHLSPGTKQFASAYLVTYGLAKLALVYGLLRNRRWAYPVALTVLGLFLCCQASRFVSDHSPGLGLVSMVDLIILLLIWREYRRVRAIDRAQ